MDINILVLGFYIDLLIKFKEVLSQREMSDLKDKCKLALNAIYGTSCYPTSNTIKNKLDDVRELQHRAAYTSDCLDVFRTRLAIMDRDITLDDLDGIFESIRDLEDLVYKAIINLRKEETQNEKP